MSQETIESTRIENCAYIGRDGCGPVKVALGILVTGLFLSAVYNPSEKKELNNSVKSSMLPDQTPNAPSVYRGELKLTLASASPNQDDRLVNPDRKQHLKVRKGDTLSSILMSAGVPKVEALSAINSLRTVYNPRDLKIGHKINLIFSHDNKLKELQLDPTAVRKISIHKDTGTTFRVLDTKRPLIRRMQFARGSIRSSLYKAAMSKNVPPVVLSELIRIYSWDVDFQREIQREDAFEVAYERFIDDEGQVARNGGIIFAKLILSGQPKALYRFKIKPGTTEYFDQNGRSAKRPLLRTPIDGARLSSRFGKRRHPILGFTKFHRGVDFAAPRGTPIFAAGDGVITFRGRKGAYGKYVRIRHAGKYTTAYGHLSRFKKGVTRGRRVTQGQVIGYVGNTGRSTGPHLHYEILTRGKQVNPLTVKMPSGIKLTHTMLSKFQATRANIDAVVFNLQGKTLVSLQ